MDVNKTLYFQLVFDPYSSQNLKSIPSDYSKYFIAEVLEVL